MKKVQLTETVLRDANQSLMATRLPYSDYEGILADMDKAGYYLDKAGTDNGVLREKSLLLQGQRYIGLKEFDKALESLSKVLELNPGSADAYYYIGEVYEAKGEMQKAKTQWRKAYNLNPDHYKSKLKLFK